MNEKKKNYKDTLNLPNTAFDMRAGLLKKEPDIQTRWSQTDIYGQIRKARAGGPRFILHDGPPYANGNIHMGTALNKILKDIVIRYKNMAGFDAPYIHGWDCHGLPIEYRVQSELGDNLIKMSHSDVRRRCAEYADKYVRIQAEQFQRLGVIGEFDRPYITMTPEYESAVLEVFARLVEQGLVFRQLKPVHWSIENRTALAEAELEYHDREDDSIYVLLAAADSSALKDMFGLDDPAPAYLMVWTTTPWTLPANLAVAVHPDFEYSAVKFSNAGKDVIAVIASDLAEKVCAVGGVEKFDVLAGTRGAAMVDAGITYLHPLIEGKICPLVPANYVTLEDGTGLVHTAPGHGMEDYGTALKCDLEVYCPVAEDGRLDETAPNWLVGKSVWGANPLVVDFLNKAGTLFHRQTITHSYPHDWRSKTPTIFRATEQWFVSVDGDMKRGTTLREMAMNACRKTAEDGGMDFVPGWGRNRLAGMLESRPDWCISRQRSWGLPIPAFYNENGQVFLTAASVRAVAKRFAEKGSDCWFKDSPAELLGDYDPACDPDLGDLQFDIGRLSKNYDIFDVWFESGSSWFAAAIQRGLVGEIPVDLYLEGSDQHRGWFQLSLLLALGAAGLPPFRAVLTHGYVVDEEGRTKMSKSLGNVMNVVDQISRRGADILRLWVASQNYTDDVRCSENLIAQSDEAYRKIRNTLRFCMGACCDFDPAANAAEPSEHSIDRWMRLELHRLVRDVRGAYDRYEFHRAARMMHEFCTVQASSVYMSAVKDRLYCELPDSPRRRASQTVLHEMLVTLLKLLAPILPHTVEEAWEHVPNRDPEEPESIHLALLPEYDEAMLKMAEDLRPVNPDLAQFSSDEIQVGPAWIWDRLLELRSEGLVKLEALRNAGVKNPLDTEAVFIVAEDDPAAETFLETYLGELEDLLGVGYARIEKISGTGFQPVSDTIPIGIRVDDTREKYSRCARSWKRRPDVGADPEYPDLSARDAAVMKKLGNK
ncbi:MAG: isoleucine--tRNA ligase [Planctomycetota bacterium]|nr:isoleucine--tRNA ligase [Planctomycetota bacterium]